MNHIKIQLIIDAITEKIIKKYMNDNPDTTMRDVHRLKAQIYSKISTLAYGALTGYNPDKTEAQQIHDSIEKEITDSLEDIVKNL